MNFFLLIFKNHRQIYPRNPSISGRKKILKVSLLNQNKISNVREFVMTLFVSCDHMVIKIKDK